MRTQRSYAPGPRVGAQASLYRPPYGSDYRYHHGSGGPGYAGHYPHRYPVSYGHGYYAHHPPPYWRAPYACSPVWWGPVVYPAGFGLTWHSGSFALSIATYAPVASYTRYYDSWCGGVGYAGVYYGGWSSGWYGGFSYVYNPWPVYRTYYLYEPALTVTRTETVYVTQPAETVYVAQPPAATTTAAAEPPAAAPAAGPATGEATPAGAEAEASTCLCTCRCNGQRLCVCSYPCGAEYAFGEQELNLGVAYTPYSVALNPETIWLSYAGLDRWDASAEAFPLEADGTFAGNP